MSELELVPSEESEELEVVVEPEESLLTDGLASEVVSLALDDLVVFDQECFTGAEESDVPLLSGLAGAEAAVPAAPEEGLDVL